MRMCQKLALPQSVQENIAKLRISPMVYKHVHRPKQVPTRRATPTSAANWRENVLAEYVRRVKEREDPEYSDVFAIFNKVAMSNVEKLSNDAVGYIQKRDDAFRLRITTLLFDKAITQHAYAAVMAECAKRIIAAIPDMKEDIQTQVSMFPTLYNINETLTFPHSSDPEFNNKVIECMKQKEKRRGYSKFMMELCVRDIVTSACVIDGLSGVVSELTDIAKQTRSAQTEENVGQFAVFLYETAVLAKNHADIKTVIKTSIDRILNTDRAELQSLNMKSRFKLEDAFKYVQ